ncbi:MAG: DUF1638 domain-containing protein [Faecousia sp.]
MKRMILSCPTLKKELMRLLCDHHLEYPVYFLPSKLHSSPSQLHEYLQAFIDEQQDVDQILICVSGCGGGTSRLKATTAELVIPKTRDCVDILLSQDSVPDIHRAADGIFLTDSWMEFFRESSLDYQSMVNACGQSRAEERLKTIYQGFEHFYIIDTGTYALTPVKEYIQPLVTLLGGTLEIVPGKCGILKKLVTGIFDDDFQIVPKGTVSK